MGQFRIVAGLGLLWLLISGPAVLAQDKGGLYVAEFAWTDRINPDRTIGRQFTKTAPIAPLLLWTRMVGGEAALEALRAQNRLPIWHRWFVSCGAEVDFVKSARPVDEIDLKIEGGGTLDALAREVGARSFFDWDTWSGKDQVKGCRYTVKIVDNQARPIWCESLAGNCEISIELKGQPAD